MADFQPKFVDLVRNYSTTVGAGNFALSAAVNGYSGFADVLQPGDSFYYSAIGVDKPAEREVGRGTLNADDTISREPIGGKATNFSSGTKSIALIAAAEWFTTIQANGSAPVVAPVLAPSRDALASASGPQPAILSEAGREGLFVWDGSDLSAEVSADPFEALYIAAAADPAGSTGAWVRKFSGPALASWFGAKGDGASDDSAALSAALALADHLHIPAGIYLVSGISVPSNRTISTAGFETTIMQAAGTPDTTRILTIAGSNVRIGDIALTGQIGSSSGEQNHAVIISSSTSDLCNVSIGNVLATDIRGDAVYAGMFNGHSASQIKVGQIAARNVWRNGLTVADGVCGLDVESVVEQACGQHTIDFEPNSANGSSGIRIGYVRGRHLQLAGGNGPLTGIEIGAADLDLAFGSNSSPPNPFDHKISGQAVGTDNAIYCAGAVARIGRATINGYTGQAVTGGGGSIVPRLSFGSLEITNCCTADTLYNSLIQGGGIDYRIGELTASTALSTQRVFDSCGNAQVGKAKIALASGSYYMKNCTDCRTDELVMTAAGAGNGGIAINGTRCIVGGGIQTGDRLFSYATRCVAVGVDATMVTGYDVSGTSNKFIGSRIGGAFYHLYGIGGTLQLSDAGSLNAPGFVRAAADIRSSSASGGIGYTTGAGGSVTQSTSKSTGVTLNKVCGKVTMNAASLDPGQTAEFAVTNSTVAASDTVGVNLAAGAAATSAYRCWVSAVAAGSFNICVENRSAAALGEALVLNFAVLKATSG